MSCAAMRCDLVGLHIRPQYDNGLQYYLLEKVHHSGYNLAFVFGCFAQAPQR